jgi:TRAP-type C4-dicarboxylate transport system permease small subunit
MIKTLAQVYVKAENFITNLLIIGVVFFVFIAAVMRWAGSPISWSVEFAQLLFVWVIFLGANRTLREGNHISVDFLTKKLPVKVRSLNEIFMNVLVIAFLGFIGYYGILLSIENSVRQISNIGLSYSIVTIAVPIGCFLMIVTLLNKLAGNIRSFTKNSLTDGKGA